MVARPPYRPMLTLLMVAGVCVGAAAGYYRPVQWLQEHLPGRWPTHGQASVQPAVPCSSCRHLRLVDGRVVVFYGTSKEPNPQVKQRTDITAEMLMEADRRNLEKGVDLPSDAAVRQWLEFDRH